MHMENSLEVRAAVREAPREQGREQMICLPHVLPSRRGIGNDQIHKQGNVTSNKSRTHQRKGHAAWAKPAPNLRPKPAGGTPPPPKWRPGYNRPCMDGMDGSDEYFMAASNLYH
jgi:hypothetical protein